MRRMGSSRHYRKAVAGLSFVADDCWLNPDVEVRASAIEGQGLFAIKRIPRGEIVSRLGGRVVTTAGLHRLIDESAHYVDTITVGDDQHLVLPPGTPNGKGNHSCDPNLWWSGPVELVARRDILSGEELTNDYAASTCDPQFVMSCRCRATSCRGTIRGTDAADYHLAARYEGHVVPALSRHSP